MAQIPTFNVTEGRSAAAAGRIQPSELGIETLQQGARNISRLGREGSQAIETGLGQFSRGIEDLGKTVERHQTLAEINAMGPVSANVFQNLTESLNTAVASGDPNAVTKWRDTLEDQLDQLGSQANTPGSQAHAIQMAENLRKHFLDTALPATLAQQAGHQAVVNNGMTVNTLANTVADNPAALPTAIQTYSAQVDAIADNHNLTPNERAKLSNELKTKGLDQIVGNSITAVIHGNPAKNIPSDPEAGVTMVDKYSQYLTPEVQQHLRQTAVAQTQFNQRQAGIDRAESSRIEKEAANTALNNIWAKAIQPDGSIRYDGALMAELGRIAGDMPGAVPGEVQSTWRALQSMADKQGKQAATQTDPTVYSQLLTRAFKPDSDPDHLTIQDLGNAVTASKLSNKDFSFLYQTMQRTQRTGLDTHLENKSVDSFLSSVQGKYGYVGPVAPSTDASTAYSRFLNWFQPAYQEAKAHGRVGQFMDQLLDKDDAWYNRFKTSAGAANAGSGLSATGPQAAPVVAAPSGQPQPEGLLYHWFGIGR